MNYTVIITDQQKPGSRKRILPGNTTLAEIGEWAKEEFPGSEARVYVIPSKNHDLSDAEGR